MEKSVVWLAQRGAVLSVMSRQTKSNLWIYMWSLCYIFPCHEGNHLFSYNVAHRMKLQLSQSHIWCAGHCGGTWAEQLLLLCSSELQCASGTQVEKGTGWETSVGRQRHLLYSQGQVQLLGHVV